MMASLAHDAIAIVLREHVGHLQSFKYDRRKILNRTYDLLQEYIAHSVELTKAGRPEEIERIKAHTLERIRTLAQTDDDFDTIWFRTIDNWKQQRADDNRKDSPDTRRRRENLNETYDLLQDHRKQLVKLTKAGKDVEAKGHEVQTLRRIRAIAPTEDDFDTIWFKTIDNWKQQRVDDNRNDKRNDRRRVKRRTDRTD